jgi:hypothetical protein
VLHGTGDVRLMLTTIKKNLVSKKLFFVSLVCICPFMYSLDCLICIGAMTVYRS